jgi:hypothetical protein
LIRYPYYPLDSRFRGNDNLFLDRFGGHDACAFFQFKAITDGDMVAEYGVIKLAVITDLAVIRQY